MTKKSIECQYRTKELKEVWIENRCERDDLIEKALKIIDFKAKYIK